MLTVQQVRFARVVRVQHKIPVRRQKKCVATRLTMTVMES
jgi:hypothetical protein